MTDIVFLTSSERRHEFVRKAVALANGVSVLRSYCEDIEGTALDAARESGSSVQIDHLERRAMVEEDFFGPFCRLVEDRSNPVEVERGEVNNEIVYQEIIDLDPDALVAYGCSIIREPLLSKFEGRFINVHLGLSPYYRGTGTNFWPLVNGEPEYVGATFMHLSEKIDAGEIIHQIRGRVHPGDGPHQIGNRVIADVAELYPTIIRNLGSVGTVEPPVTDEERYYRSDDFSDSATQTLYDNFHDGLIGQYLEERESRITTAPIAKNPPLEEAGPSRGPFYPGTS